VVNSSLFLLLLLSKLSVSPVYIVLAPCARFVLVVVVAASIPVFVVVADAVALVWGRGAPKVQLEPATGIVVGDCYLE
jgi:predicted aconitase with swiveling domain